MYIYTQSRSNGQPAQAISMSDEPASPDQPDREWIIRKTMAEVPIQGCELLFRRYYVPLCSHAVRFVYSRAIAEDLVADVFCDFWANRLFEQVATSYRAYLFRMVRNRSLNYLQRELLKYPTESLLEMSMENPVVYPETPSSLEELSQAIEQAVQHLPPQCKHVFLLSRFEGKRIQEIADQLQISPRTVETHISKALAILRQTLRKLGFISLLGWLFIQGLQGIV
jgi:RNA polymerase sigma-70 factor (family 1)